MIRPVLNDEHLDVLGEALASCRRRLFIATANLKEVHLPVGRRRARSVVDLLGELAARGVEVRILHGSLPSGRMIERLKEGVPVGVTFRRCPRMHVKAVIVDARRMYLGSANITGAGIGAKSARRRNFEAGVWTDEPAIVDAVGDMLQCVWDGQQCDDCDRRDFCPEPLEEPAL